MILRNAYKGLAYAYSTINDFRNAFKYETLFTGVKDSLYNLGISKAIIKPPVEFRYSKETKPD